MKKNILTFSKGPQFHGGRTALIFLILLAFLFISIAGCVQGEYLPALILFPFILVLSFFIFDIRGTQIDIERELIREYKLFLWVKFGKWQNYKPFNLILLKYISHQIETADFSSGRFGKTATEVHGIFTVFLTNPEDTKRLVMAEFAQYRHALHFADRLSETLNLPFLDNFEIRLETSRNRRRR